MRKNKNSHVFVVCKERRGDKEGHMLSPTDTQRRIRLCVGQKSEDIKKSVLRSPSLYIARISQVQITSFHSVLEDVGQSN